MAGDPEVRLWRARLRWRVRSGSWQWPAFFFLTAGEAVLMHSLPIAGDAQELVSAFLLAGFFNLALCAVAGPLVGRWWHRRRRSVPVVVAVDRASTAGLLTVLLVLLALGLAHHPAVTRSRREFALQLTAARLWIIHRAPAEYRRNLGKADTWEQGPHLYRTCVPGADPRRSLCLIVDTAQPVGATVTRDPDQDPNDVLAGPDNPGRVGG